MLRGSARQTQHQNGIVERPAGTGMDDMLIALGSEAGKSSSSRLEASYPQKEVFKAMRGKTRCLKNLN